MPYIAFDLKAIEDAPSIARLARCSEDMVLGGLGRMWAYCWKTKVDRLSRFQIVGLFGDDTTEALIVFGYLELMEREQEYRVRGAERYLRIAKAKAIGGHAAKKNLIPGGMKGKAKPDAKSSAYAEELPKTRRRAAEEVVGESSALTQNTEHRTQNIKTTTLSISSTDQAETKKPKTPKGQAVFDHWLLVMKHPRAVFDKKRQKAVERMLNAGYGEDDLRRAVDGCAKTPHNMGQNERGERYDDLELICRDAAHVDRFIRNAGGKPIQQSREEQQCIDLSA